MSNASYRSKAIEEHGCICAECGATEDIEVHHRDADRSNNELKNLIPLCQTCHRHVHAGSDEHTDLVLELGGHPRSLGDNTTIAVDDETADELHAMKQRGDSYDDVIRRLIAEHKTEGDQ